MSRYDILLFDADQTILNFNKASKLALKETMRKRGIRFTNKDFSLFIKINDGVWRELEKGTITKPELYKKRFEVLLDHINAKGDPMEINAEYVKGLQSRCILIKNAKRVVKKLSKDYRLFIITNGTKSVQEKRMSKCVIKDCFEKMYISEDIGVQKPSVKFFEFVLNDLSIKDKSKVLIIGDSLSSDIQGGINAGIDTCWFCTDENTKTDLEYTYKISDLLKVIDIVK